METALVRACNDLLINSGAGSLTVLVLLEIAAAFSSVNHGVLLDCLMFCAGLSKCLLSVLSGARILVLPLTYLQPHENCVYYTAGFHSSSTNVHYTLHFLPQHH